MSPPTILLIQGSFQLPEIYHNLVKGLRAKEYEVIHPSLPSITNHDDPAFPTRTIADDAAVVHAQMVKLIEEQEKTIVVLMHSYGGLVGCEAIPEDLTRKVRHSKGLAGGVSYLILYAAFVLDQGQSVLGVWGESPNNDILAEGRYSIKDPRQRLFSDLSDTEAEHWLKYVVPQSHAVESYALTRASYTYVPSAYIVCTEDEACPPPFQRMFAEQVKSKVVELQSGHSPHLSHLDILIEKADALIREASVGESD